MEYEKDGRLRDERDIKITGRDRRDREIER